MLLADKYGDEILTLVNVTLDAFWSSPAPSEGLVLSTRFWKLAPSALNALTSVNRPVTVTGVFDPAASFTVMVFPSTEIDLEMTWLVRVPSSVLTTTGVVLSAEEIPGYR